MAMIEEKPAIVFVRDEISEIIVDDENTFKDAKKYLKQVTPNNLKICNKTSNKDSFSNTIFNTFNVTS